MNSCLLVEDTSICNSCDHKNERVGSTVLFTVVICLFEKRMWVVKQTVNLNSPPNAQINQNYKLIIVQVGQGEQKKDSTSF